MAIWSSTLEKMVMDKNFWIGKRVFLTGHTGFKGSWLSLWLQHLGAKVTGYALDPPTDPSLFCIADVAAGMTSIISDIQDEKSLSQAMQEARPEIVIHMAAQALVRNSYALPKETYSINVMGCVNLFESVRRTKSVRVVVNVTSDKCYENKEWIWGYRETDPMGGYDPYSSSKACAELITSAYRKSFFHPSEYGKHGVSIASVRAGNVIGGGDWATDRLIPDILRAIQAGKSVKIRNPNAIRPWQHVLDPLNGYLMLIEKLYSNGIKFGGSWNFGANNDDIKSVQWIVENLIMLWADSASWDLDESPQSHEASQLKLDCTKAKTELGWKPHWSLMESLNQIVTWSKSQQKGQDMRDFTLQQIACFSEQSAR